MQIMRNYSDLLVEIELIKYQIKMTERELEYWFGIDKEGKGIPLGGEGSFKYGANTSVIQADKKIKSLNKLESKLEYLKYAKSQQDILLKSLEGIDYKIAYKRIVELKTHKEIADDLGYSHQYIRERWANMKTYKEPTDTIENV